MGALTDEEFNALFLFLTISAPTRGGQVLSGHPGLLVGSTVTLHPPRSEPPDRGTLENIVKLEVSPVQPPALWQLHPSSVELI